MSHMSHSSTNKDRIAWIDLLETIAIFMVVLYHSRFYISDIIGLGSLGTYVNYFFNTTLAVSVPLFFFVNGYLLLSKKFDFKRHLRKIIKLTLITLIWYGITLAWLVFLHREWLEMGGLGAVLNAVKSGINHLWFMGALICIYLFFPLLKIVYDQNKKVFLYFTIICLIFTIGNTLLNEVLTVGSQLLGRPHIFHEYNFFNIFNPFRGIYGYSFTYFCLGGILYKYIDCIKHISARNRNLLALGLLLLGCFGLFGVGVVYSRMGNEEWNVMWNGYDTIFTMLNVAGLLLLSLNFQKASRLITVISRNTLGIYLTHMLFVELLRPVAGQIQFFHSFGGNMIYALGILVISLLFVGLIRKIPLLRNLVA